MTEPTIRSNAIRIAETALNTAEMRRLGKAATPLPWLPDCNWDDIIHINRSRHKWDVATICGMAGANGVVDDDQSESKANAAFIVFARNHWTAICDELERLRSRVAELEGKV